MQAKYESESEVHDLVRSFEEATISRDDWHHAEHLVVALFYLSCSDFDTATDKMRAGLFNLLRTAFKVDLDKEMPYHETLTVFWMRTVADLNSLMEGASLEEKANRLVAAFDKDYPLRFYSRELLFSDEARERYVEPDLDSRNARFSGSPIAGSL